MRAHWILGVALATLGGAVQADDAPLARGKYMLTVMDCGGCHTPSGPDMAPDQSRYLGGGTLGFDMGPMGIFWPPNLTNDMETGLGSWSDEQIIAAFTTGVRPDGRELAPIMPWRAYAAITPEDAAALVAYLRTLPVVSNKVPDPVGPGQPAAAPYLTVKLPE